MTIKALLFDLDGTLIDSTDWHVEALNIALESNSEQIISMGDEKVLFQGNGPGISTKQKLEILHEKRGLCKTKFEKIYEDKKLLTEKIIQKRCKASKSTIELLEKAKNCGYKLAICSNAGRSSVDCILRCLKIKEYFSIVITNDDVVNRKPHPEAYLKAIDFFNLKPKECLAIEDSNKGYESAKKSGCFVIKVNKPEEVDMNLIEEKIKNIHVNIIIPAAGEGSRFKQVGYKNPKPFIDVNGKCMLHRVLDDLKSENYIQKYFVLIKKEHLNIFDKKLKQMKKEYDVDFIPVDVATEGTACTVLFARNFIKNDCPTIVANSDELVDISVDDLLDDMFERNLDGNILVFKDKELNPKWSFAEVDGEGFVLRTKEKEPISEYATSGLYCFRQGSKLMDSCLEMIIRNDRTKGEFYFCPVYNHYIKNNKKVGIYLIEQNKMHGLGTPEDLKYFLENCSNENYITPS